jgi:hypothetical protein
METGGLHGSIKISDKTLERIADSQGWQHEPLPDTDSGEVYRYVIAIWQLPRIASNQ